MATPLLVIVLSTYGDRALADDPETGEERLDPIELWNMVERDYRTTIPLEAENRLNAIMLALTSDLFFEDPIVFTAVCGALSQGELPDMVNGFMDDLVEHLTLAECLWGLYEVALVRDDDLPLGPRIEALIERIARDEVEEDVGDPLQIIPHYERFVIKQRHEMIQQLRLLGLPEEMLARLAAEDPTPYNDDAGQWEDPTPAKSSVGAL